MRWARTVGRLAGIGWVLAIAVRVLRCTSPYRWLQALVVAWSAPFVLIGFVGGSVAARWVGVRLWRWTVLRWRRWSPFREVSVASVKRILLIDDEPSTTDMLGRLLRLQGYHVTAASTAAEARAAAIGASFDLIITDIHLPDGSGTELMRQLTTPGKTPAIALSGWSEEDLTPDEQALFAAFVVKPVALDKLLEVVRKVLATPPP